MGKRFTYKEVETPDREDILLPGAPIIDDYNLTCSRLRSGLQDIKPKDFEVKKLQSSD